MNKSNENNKNHEFTSKRIDYLKDKVSDLPMSPGCYIYKDINNHILYVGKAKSLKNRVGSYFSTSIQPGTKTYALVNKIYDFEYILAHSEIEAFVLEAELIKKHKPKYNINLKDDKSYLYIIIRKEKIDDVVIPIVKTARKSDLKKGDISYGPFPDGSTTKYVLKTIRKIFSFRDCSTTKFNSHKKLKRPCLYGDLKLCSAPCVNNDLDSYNKNIKNIKNFLSGKSKTLINDLNKKMSSASKSQNYEEAAKYRDLIKKFKYITTGFRAAYQYIENPHLLDDIATNSLLELKNNISILTEIPYRIECYDIANLQGKEGVGSMVVATNGHIDKTEYKKFRIKLKNTPDDYFMLREVLTRRLRHEIKDSNLKPWGLPDLLVIDGGKGQVSTIQNVVDELNLKIPVIGLAKRLETIVFKHPVTDEFVEINLKKTNLGLKLLISLRDEAHRFSRRYHHYLRTKKMYN